jgi:sulfur-oxidizing protein SoxZ
MADETKPRVKIPPSAKAGEVIVIKTLINHVMETGLRKDADGNLIPRKIINKFTCEFNGQPVYSTDLEPAISANPFFEFNAKVAESGTFKFTWFDDDGSVYEAEEQIVVE